MNESAKLMQFYSLPKKIEVKYATLQRKIFRKII
jgi:hypothetical protein